jgi:hypothetical protein
LVVLKPAPDKASATAGGRITSDCAMAVRWVATLSLTSTMLGLPLESMCDKVLIQPPM